MIVLGSGESEIWIDEDTGRIAGVTREGRNLIGAPSGGPLRLHLPFDDFESHQVIASHTRPHVSVGPNEVIVSYDDLIGDRGRTGVSAEMKVRSRHDGTFALTCVVENRSQSPVPQVFFPWIGGLSRVDGDDDEIRYGLSSLRPWQELRPLRDHERVDFFSYLGEPHRTIPYIRLTYELGMKWMNFGGHTAGVSIYSEEVGWNPQAPLVSVDSYRELGRHLNLAWMYWPMIQPTGSWESPTFVVYPHEGDWHSGVVKFREFADRAFTPVESSQARDSTIGQYTLWMGWHYQDRTKPRYTFDDIPSLASEAKAAGLLEMTLARSTALDFCLPHILRTEFGSSDSLKTALAAANALGVNVIPFVTCHIIRPNTIRPSETASEWFVEDAGGGTMRDNWSYHPGMIPMMPIPQIGSRSGSYVCAGSQGWREAYFAYLNELITEWSYRGIMFDESFPLANFGLCFNELHDHSSRQNSDELITVLRQTKRLLLERWGPDAVFSGEGVWDTATEWQDFSWGWDGLGDDEQSAAFHMAFPRARACKKAADDVSLVNRIFICGYWLDLYLEEGGGRLGDYPALTTHLARLADFKRQFSRFFNARDEYLHTMFVEAQPSEGLWHRAHRSGAEALVLVADAHGREREVTLSVDTSRLVAPKPVTLTMWTLGLRQESTVTVTGMATLHLRVPEGEFIAIHAAEATR